MKTVQMTLDEALLVEVDKEVRRLQTSRSAFTREALYRAVREARAKGLEERHRRGYASKPVADREFAVWEDEQKWGEP